MQMKQQKINHSRLYNDCQYSTVQILEEMLFLCCQNRKASTAKKKNYTMYATWKDTQDSEIEYMNYAVRIISNISQTIKIKLKGITWQKSL